MLDERGRGEEKAGEQEAGCGDDERGGFGLGKTNENGGGGDGKYGDADGYENAQRGRFFGGHGRSFDEVGG